MKVSELTIPIIANYCRIMDDDVSDSENLSLEAMKIAAISYARSYTGLSDLEMERHDKNNVNRTAEVILSMHAKNLLPRGEHDGD